MFFPMRQILFRNKTILFPLGNYYWMCSDQLSGHSNNLACDTHWNVCKMHLMLLHVSPTSL